MNSFTFVIFAIVAQLIPGTDCPPSSVMDDLDRPKSKTSNEPSKPPVQEPTFNPSSTVNAFNLDQYARDLVKHHELKGILFKLVEFDSNDMNSKEEMESTKVFLDKIVGLMAKDSRFQEEPKSTVEYRIRPASSNITGEGYPSIEFKDGKPRVVTFSLGWDFTGGRYFENRLNGVSLSEEFEMNMKVSGMRSVTMPKFLKDESSKHDLHAANVKNLNRYLQKFAQERKLEGVEFRFENIDQSSLKSQEDFDHFFRIGHLAINTAASKDIQFTKEKKRVFILVPDAKSKNVSVSRVENSNDVQFKFRTPKDGSALVTLMNELKVEIKKLSDSVDPKVQSKK